MYNRNKSYLMILETARVHLWQLHDDLHLTIEVVNYNKKHISVVSLL